MTVEISGLQKSYGNQLILRDLTMQARDGEFLTLLGPSGCGKTTTLRCVAGLEHADGGTIAISGTVVAAPERRLFVPPNKRDIGMVFQSYALWPHMTVFGNVAYPLRVRHHDRSSRRDRVMRILETVGMAGYAQRSVTELSGGQQQRVALARAMVANPRLLLFDEPLSNLDSKLRRSMRHEIRQAHDLSGATSLYVTHDQEEAITLSDRVVVLREGVIQQMGTPREIYREPANPFVADFVGFDNLLPVTVTESSAAFSRVAIEGVAERVTAALGLRGQVGSGAVLAVRAEDLTIGGPSPDGSEAGSLTGVIQSRTYTGQHTEYVVLVGGQTLLVRVSDDRTDDAAGQLAPGAEACVRFDPAMCVVVGGSEPSPQSDETESRQAKDPASLERAATP